jgi:hypothetical protein
MKISIVALGLVFLPACSNELALDEGASSQGDVTVTAPASMRWEDAGLGTGEGIRATVVNNGSESYYATLGDAFLGAEEQSLLFTAEGGDSYFERLEGNEWVPAARAVMIEGLRTVVLRPNGSYTLLAYAMGDKATGTYRIRVVYFTTADRTVQAGEAFSRSIELK